MPASKVLLVEGKDDKLVVCRLCQRNNLEMQFRIEVKDNIDKLLKSIRLEIEAPERKSIGILVDANDNRDSRWQSVTDRLRKKGIAPPKRPNPAGTIIEGNPDIGRPRIGIWLMPDNQSSGELEDFIVKMIPTGDPVWPRSETYIDGIPVDDREFKEGKILRAKVNAWLATREEPRKMGLAIKTEDLEIVGATCVSFVAWLRELFK